MGTRSPVAQAMAWAFTLSIVVAGGTSMYAAYHYWTAHGPGSGNAWRNLFWYCVFIFIVSAVVLAAMMDDESNERKWDRQTYRRAAWGPEPEEEEDG